MNSDLEFQSYLEDNLLGQQDPDGFTQNTRKLAVLQDEYVKMVNLLKIQNANEQAMAQLNTNKIELGAYNANELNPSKTLPIHRIQEHISDLTQLHKEFSMQYKSNLAVSAQLEALYQEISSLEKIKKENELKLSKVDTSTSQKVQVSNDKMHQNNYDLEKEISGLQAEVDAMENTLKVENDKVLEIKKTSEQLKSELQSTMHKKDSLALELNGFYNSTRNKSNWLKQVGIVKKYSYDGDNSINFEVHNDRLDLALPNKADDSQFVLNATSNPSTLQLKSVHVQGGNEETNIQFSDIARFSGGDLHSILYRTWYVQNHP